MAYTNFLGWIKEIFNELWNEHFNTQEMYDKAVDIEPLSLAYVSDHFKTQKMCNKAVEGDPWLLNYVPHNQCVIRLLKKLHGCCTMFLLAS